MYKKHLIIGLLIVTAIILSACGANPKQQPPMLDSGNALIPEQAPMEEQVLENMDAEKPAAMPAWFTIGLNDVNSGGVFKVADFQGKVILVETMAMWCPKCLSQQKEVAKLHDALSAREDFISIALDIDPNEDAAALADYARKNNFNWLYTVASDEVINEISVLYGAQFLNPPATPMLIIDRQGNSHLLPFGIISAEELQAAVQPFLDAEG